jgi:hypothetical protein
VRALEQIAKRSLPLGSVVLVASETERTLPALDDLVLRPFPRHEGDQRSLPADSADAIRQLEAARLEGAGYLLLPDDAFSWLDRYPELSSHLQERHRLVAASEAGLLFSLSVAEESAEGESRPDGHTVQLEDFIGKLLPEDAVVAVVNVRGEGPKPPGCRIWVPALASGDVRAAGEQVEALRAGGVEYLVIPRSAQEWSERHPELVRHLEGRHRLVTRQANLCEIYEL